MPAQILPLVNDAHLAMYLQRMQGMQQYHEAQIGLREQALQNQQMMEPMRQKLMAAELQRTQQGIQESLQASTQRQQMAPFEQARLQSETERNQTVTQSTQFRDALEFHNAIRDQKLDEMRKDHLTNELNKSAQDLAFGAASHYANMATWDQGIKTPIVQQMISKGQVSPEIGKAIINTDLGKEKVDEPLSQVFGPGGVFKFHQYDKPAQSNVSSKDAADAKSLGQPTESDRAKMVQGQLMDVAFKVLERRSKGLQGLSDKPLPLPWAKDEKGNVTGVDEDKVIKDQVYQLPMAPHPEDPSRMVPDKDSMIPGIVYDLNGTRGKWDGTHMVPLGAQSGKAQP